MCKLAFPSKSINPDVIHEGISERLYIATKIASSLIALETPKSVSVDDLVSKCVTLSYKVADELIKQEKL